MILTLLVPLVLAIAGAVALGLGLRLDPLLSWLISISLFTLVTYGYDKLVAGSEHTRVPERVLLLLALLGGTLGAALGMAAFHHKTSKGGFLLRFALVILIQIAIIIAYTVWIKPWFVAVFK